MKINTDYVQYLRKLSDSYSFGCDYLNITIKKEMDIWSEVQISNTTNSNYSVLPGSLFNYTATLTKALNSNEIVINLVHDDISYPVMRLIKFHGPKYGNTIGLLNVYGTAFRLMEIGIIPSLEDLLLDFFTEDDFELIYNSNISRYDYKLDLFYSKLTALPKEDKLINGKQAKGYSYRSSLKAKPGESTPEFVLAYINKMIKKNDSSRIDYDSDRQVTGWSQGSSKNKCLIIRTYNKVLDILIKKKRGLYSDYLQYETVNRIELELKSKALRDEDNNPLTLADLDRIESIGKVMLGIAFSNETTKYKYQPNTAVLEPSKPYLQQLINRSLVVHSNGMNPYSIVATGMIAKGVSKDKTLDQLYEAIDEVEGLE